MEYKIRCNKCGDVFKARTERQGLQKVRCPYCGSVLNCQLGGDNLSVQRPDRLFPSQKLEKWIQKPKKLDQQQR